MLVEFRVLGPLELAVDGRLVPLGSPKQRALLGLLVLHANETLSRDRLIEELWGEAAPVSVEAELHVYLSRLRKLLESVAAGGLLARDGHGYRLRVEPEQLDLGLFERLVGEGREALAAGEVGVAAERFGQSLALWRGPALSDLQGERFAVAAGARLDGRHVSVLEQRFEAELALGRDSELVGELETLVEEYPYRERLRGQLMLALYRSGRQVEALSVYRQARRTLAGELGLEPGQELRQLERCILRSDPALAAPTAAQPEPGATAAQAPGRVVERREERKLVSVLAARVVASTAGAGEDPEDVRTLQERYWNLVRLEVERHGGTVDGLAGSRVSAVFGAPRVREDDPERAVRAALAIREQVRAQVGVDVRAVVTTGDALVQLEPPQRPGESLAAGEVAEAAVRLLAAAPTSTVLVDEHTYAATRTVIDYGDAGPAEAPSKSERVWSALKAHPLGATDVAANGAPLVGRQRELRLLLETLARVRAEREPELVTLVGAAGIGKTRLVEELRDAAGGDDGRSTGWLQGRSLPYGEDASWSALAELVKAQVGALESDSDKRIEQKLARAVNAVVGDGREAEWVARALRPLLGIAEAHPAATLERDEAFAAWRRFFEALAESQPLVLVFEDLHWAEETLLEFVDGLPDWLSGVPLLVLATARPELFDRRPDWGGGKANASTLTLSALSDQESARLLAALSRRLASRGEGESVLLAKVGGNPFFAEQYARIVEEGADARDPSLPETVQRTIAARLDLLPPPGSSRSAARTTMPKRSRTTISVRSI